MAAYQELHADGGEDGPHKEELEEIIGEIEKLHAQVCDVPCGCWLVRRRALGHPSSSAP